MTREVLQQALAWFEDVDGNTDERAAWAYQQADAMLKARDA